MLNNAKREWIWVSGCPYKAELQPLIPLIICLSLDYCMREKFPSHLSNSVKGSFSFDSICSFLSFSHCILTYTIFWHQYSLLTVLKSFLEECTLHHLFASPDHCPHFSTQPSFPLMDDIDGLPCSLAQESSSWLSAVGTRARNERWAENDIRVFVPLDSSPQAGSVPPLQVTVPLKAALSEKFSPSRF